LLREDDHRQTLVEEVGSMSEDEMVKDYEPPEHEHFEITVAPEDEDLVVGIERVNLQVESRAREQAQADFVSYLVGEWTPRSEVAHWPARYKDAYESEFERLRRERAER
jgi:hypothetical protein